MWVELLDRTEQLRWNGLPYANVEQRDDAVLLASQDHRRPVLRMHLDSVLQQVEARGALEHRVLTLLGDVHMDRVLEVGNRMNRRLTYSFHGDVRSKQPRQLRRLPWRYMAQSREIESRSRKRAGRLEC